MTLLEACLAGYCPVVAHTSAQGEIVGLTGGHAAPAETYDGLIQGLADAIVWCAKHRSELPTLASKATACVAEQFSSDRYDATLKLAYETAMREIIGLKTG